MKILVCTPKVSYPLIDGASLRVVNIFKCLSRIHEIYLFVLRKSSDDIQAACRYKNEGIFKRIFYLESPPRFFDRSVSFLARSFLNREARRPKQVVERTLKKVAAENDIDILHVHLLPMGLLLADFDFIPKVLDLTDSFSLQFLRDLRLVNNPFRFSRKSFYFHRATRNEKSLLRKFDVTTVASPVDQDYLRKLNPKAYIKVVRNGVDADFFSPQRVEEDFPSVLFSGNMEYPPNIDAALYIAQEVLPLVRSKVPRTKFYIVGAHPSEEVRRLGRSQNIVVTGFVDDVRKYICRASVVLSPLRMGSGIKNKILEAMALGKPVVTNLMGAESLCKSARDCLVIAGNSHEIAEKTVELLRNKSLREELGRRATEVVNRKYKWEACSKEYEKTYQEMLRNKGLEHKR